jgi:hypothetical protein
MGSVIPDLSTDRGEWPALHPVRFTFGETVPSLHLMVA